MSERPEVFEGHGGASEEEESDDPDGDDDDERIVGTSPDGRYSKTNVVLGSGAFKTVYKGVDTEEARTVAWNELKTQNVSKKDREAIMNEVQLLKSMKHPNILECYEWWICEKTGKGHHSNNIVFVTDILTGGTLKQYLKIAKSIKPSVIQNWSRQILSGLMYLHSLVPPIIHRDLKCDNIFIDGASSRIKIGDMGLATLKTNSHKESVIGTPEFMAPEMYEERYNEKVDIYAFGMCVLEMLSGEYPYSECKTPASIFKKVVSGQKPGCLEKVTLASARQMIENCIAHDPDDRPSASEILDYDFFKEDFVAQAAAQAAAAAQAQATQPIQQPVQAIQPVPVQPAQQQQQQQQLQQQQQQQQQLLPPPLSPLEHVPTARSSADYGEVDTQVLLESPAPMTPVYEEEGAGSVDEQSRIENAYMEYGPAILDGEVEEIGFSRPCSVQLMFTTLVGNDRKAVHFAFHLGYDTAEAIVAELIDASIVGEEDSERIISGIQSIVDKHQQRIEAMGGLEAIEALEYQEDEHDMEQGVAPREQLLVPEQIMSEQLLPDQMMSEFEPVPPAPPLFLSEETEVEVDENDPEYQMMLEKHRQTLEEMAKKHEEEMKSFMAAKKARKTVPDVAFLPELQEMNQRTVLGSAVSYGSTPTMMASVFVECPPSQPPQRPQIKQSSVSQQQYRPGTSLSPGPTLSTMGAGASVAGGTPLAPGPIASPQPPQRHYAPASAPARQQQPQRPPVSAAPAGPRGPVPATTRPASTTPQPYGASIPASGAPGQSAFSPKPAQQPTQQQPQQGARPPQPPTQQQQQPTQQQQQQQPLPPQTPVSAPASAQASMHFMMQQQQTQPQTQPPQAAQGQPAQAQGGAWRAPASRSNTMPVHMGDAQQKALATQQQAMRPSAASSQPVLSSGATSQPMGGTGTVPTPVAGSQTGGGAVKPTPPTSPRRRQLSDTWAGGKIELPQCTTVPQQMVQQRPAQQPQPQLQQQQSRPAASMPVSPLPPAAGQVGPASVPSASGPPSPTTRQPPPAQKPGMPPTPSKPSVAGAGARVRPPSSNLVDESIIACLNQLDVSAGASKTSEAPRRPKVTLSELEQQQKQKNTQT